MAKRFTLTDTASAAVACVAALAQPLKKAFPTGIVCVIALMLIALGVTACNGTKTVFVPNVVGKPIAEATSQLEGLKLKVNVRETRVTGLTVAGQVATQDTANGMVPEGTTVNLIVEGEQPAPPATPSPSPKRPAIKIPGKR
jgi:hypothetical protein